MNPQDTRMKPYSFQGISLQFPVREKTLLTLAWFDHFSPEVPWSGSKQVRPSGRFLQVWMHRVIRLVTRTTLPQKGLP
ncbi:hypothetical protein [Pontibacter rugosus]